MIRAKKLGQLHLNTLLADLRQIRRDHGDGLKGFFLNLKIQLGGKTDSPLNAQRVLGKPLHGIAHTADAAGL